MSNVSEINALHTQAMDAAGRAFYADVHGDYQSAEGLFREAFELERRAALSLLEDTGSIRCLGSRTIRV